RDLRSVHHAADGIAPRRVRSEVLPLRLFRGYAQLGGAGGEQARRALGAGRAGMDAIHRDPMAAELNCQRFCHVHQAGIAGAAAEIAGVPGVAAADVDDATPARRLHERDDSSRTAQRSDIFHVEILQQIKSSPMTVSIGPVAVVEPPGADPLLTRMCRLPSCRAASATMRSTCSLQ